MLIPTIYPSLLILNQSSTHISPQQLPPFQGEVACLTNAKESHANSSACTAADSASSWEPHTAAADSSCCLLITLQLNSTIPWNSTKLLK